MIIPTRNDDGSGYTLEIKPMLENFPTGNDDTADVLRVNQELRKSNSWLNQSNICGYIAALKLAQMKMTHHCINNALLVMV